MKAEYQSAKVYVVTARLTGVDWWKPTVAIAMYSACERCGAPKGFLCRNAEHVGTSCSERFSRWVMLDLFDRYNFSVFGDL